MSHPSLCQEISTIWSELFDHSEFLNTEITKFVKQFEEKRQDSEVDQLLATLETVTDIRDIKIGRFMLAANNHLPSLNINLPKALALADNILQIEKEISNINT
ncbi:biogenesis of lysosome-related organelles complex 1 subunit 5 isoform X2 [Chrysoperla carnea]|uniref:biogenesis of lysosome-related organelles complex 1 subunit 5 isoform X2 n=1 Tax=Chrysoperla carnea TaxID=189513 RepID=UPI001D0894FB|nr:biogenesis of lysosome-related organelles complex 1 subunit 5 isoform X2 [Chrysoperla carnea]